MGSRSRRHVRITKTTPTNDSASSTNTTPGPAAATTSPPRAGPSVRATFTPTPLSVTPAASSSLGRSSGTTAYQAGSLSAVAMPSAKASASSIDGVTMPVNVADRERPHCNSHGELRDDEQRAAVDDVRERAGGEAEREERKALRREQQGHGEGRWRERRHQPALGHVGHVGADMRGRRRDPEEPEERVRQRAPGRSRITSHRLTRSMRAFVIRIFGQVVGEYSAREDSRRWRYHDRGIPPYGARWYRKTLRIRDVRSRAREPILGVSPRGGQRRVRSWT